MRKIMALIALSYAYLFSNEVTIADIGKSIETLYDNQVFLEKKLINTEILLQKYKQEIEEIKDTQKRQEHHDNLLNTNILQLESKLSKINNEAQEKKSTAYIVKVNAANVRKIPDLNGQIKNVFYLGSRFTSKEQTQEWVYIDDLDGWIHKNTIEEIQHGEEQ